MDAPKATTATAPKKAPGDKSQLTLWSEPYPLHNNLVLLYGKCTEHSKCTHTLSASDDAEVDAWAKRLEGPYQQMLERLHKSGGKMEFDSAFLTEVANILMDGVEKGFGSFPDSNKPDINQKWTRLFLSLRKNVFHFSSAQNFNELKELSKLMLDKAGNIRTFDEFEQAVKENGNFSKWHRQYLKAEHSHALASSTMAAKWLDFNRDADLYPNLKYETIGDKRVRDSHKELDGIVRPINDSFWDTHYPPLGWGCRCDVSPEDGGTQVTPEGKLPSIEIPTMFRNNVGKTGIIYSEKHPYFESLGDPKDKDNKQLAARTMARRALQDVVYALPKERQFVTIYKNKDGGEIRQHLLFDKTGDDLQSVMDIANYFASKENDKIELMPKVFASDTEARKLLVPDAKGKTNPDLRINGQLTDVKRNSGNEYSLKSRIKDSYEQANRTVIHLKSKLDFKTMEYRAISAFANHKNLEKISFYFEGEMTTFAKM